jgi:hypothetical protein
MAGEQEPIGERESLAVEEIDAFASVGTETAGRTCSRWVRDNREGVVWLD